MWFTYDNVKGKCPKPAQTLVNIDDQASFALRWMELARNHLL